MTNYSPVKTSVARNVTMMSSSRLAVEVGDISQTLVGLLIAYKTVLPSTLIGAVVQTVIGANSRQLLT